MRALFIFIVLSILIALTAPVIVGARFWIDGSAVIARAEQEGALRTSAAGEPLTTAERTIAMDEFSDTWRTRAFPCRTLALLWADISTPQGTSPGLPVSQKLAGMLLSERRATSVRWQMRRFVVACQLERRFDDARLLRMWLATASFGPGADGLEGAALSIFQKPSRDLNAEESAKLAALLRAPGLRDQPERWAQRARSIQERVAAHAQ